MKNYLKLICVLYAIMGINIEKAMSNDQRVLIAGSTVDCNTNRIDKEADCELILNYDYTSFDVYLIKLYKRNTGQADANDMVRDPASYKANNLLIDYSNKIELKDREKVSSLSGSFIRDEEDKGKLQIKLRIGISKFRDVVQSDRVDEENEEEPNPEGVELPTEVVDSKRQQELVIPM